MKFTVFSDDIKVAMPKVARILPNKASLPVLENIYFQIEDGSLTLSGTDLELGIKLKLVVKSEEPGVITVPGRPINDFLTAVTGEQLSFESKDDSLIINSGNAQATFVGIDAKEYPDIPSAGQDHLLTLPSSVLAEATNYVSFAASTDSNRPVLTGVLFVIEEDKLSLVATDGYRLSVKTFPATASRAVTLIAPTRFLVEAARLFGSSADSEANLVYDQEKSLVIIKNQELELSSRLIEGQFPPYAAILPSSFTTRAVLGKDDLSNALRQVAVFSRDSGNIAKIKFVPNDGLYLTSNASQVGSSSAQIKTSVEGEEFEIAFNIRYLSDLLTSLKANQVIVEMTGPVKPTLFQEMGNDTYKHVIMPVKMQS